mmetsp:Transcript_7408/g.8951  ORF Transcript_7408/g.8951 Transcript_7408/m.8951 type:complete len:394 (+) Transcript_7408:254-1435(+)
MDFEKAVADLVEGTTESKDAGSASDQLEANSKEWLNRVRGQVAKASRKSRRKRRDEENLVYEENKRLRKERDEQLLHISELEEKLREKQSELTTKPEDLRYIHQNELLRMQIEQHRIFYTKYLKLSEDVPVDEKESIETIALSKLELEGLEFSFLYVQSLLSSSVSDNWSPVELDANQFYMIKPGRDVSGSFKFVPLKQPRMNLRLDMVIRLPEDYYETDRKVNPMEACMKAVWDFWGSEKHVRNYFPVPQKFTIKKINIRSTNTEFDEYKENAHDNIDENICAYYYHELREKEKDRGWMYLVTKRLVECARSTLLLPAHLAPSSCSSIGEKKPENNNKGKKKNDKKNMKKKDSGMLYGKTKVWVMARSTVQVSKIRMCHYIYFTLVPFKYFF